MSAYQKNIKIQIKIDEIFAVNLCRLGDDRKHQSWMKLGLDLMLSVCVSRSSPWIKWMPFRTSTAPSRLTWRTTCWSAVLSSSPPSVPLLKSILEFDTEGETSRATFFNSVIIQDQTDSNMEMCLRNIWLPILKLFIPKQTVQTLSSNVLGRAVASAKIPTDFRRRGNPCLN